MQDKSAEPQDEQVLNDLQEMGRVYLVLFIVGIVLINIAFSRRRPLKAEYNATPIVQQVKRGEDIYLLCMGCHGEQGKGGVSNPNSPIGQVPSLNMMAEKLGIWEPEESQAILDILDRKEKLSTHLNTPPFDGERYASIVEEYNRVKTLIQEGRKSPKKDPNGEKPTFDMPGWEKVLNDSEIDSVMAYLIRFFEWEDEDEEEEDDDE